MFAFYRYEQGKVLIFVSSQLKCDNLFRDLLRSGYVDSCSLSTLVITISLCFSHDRIIPGKAKY